MWIRVHNISLARHMGRDNDGSLRKLREELEAENSGVNIPAEIKWLGGAKVRARFQEKKDGPLFGGSRSAWRGDFQPPLPSRSQALWSPLRGRHLEETRPNAFCSRCSGWGHIAPHCKAAAPKCSICAKDYAETDHRCPVEGCRAGRGRPCPYGTTKCPNCGGPHGTRADACTAKMEARGAARG